MRQRPVPPDTPPRRVGPLSLADTLLREEAEQNRLAGTGRAPLQTKNYAQSLQAGAVALDKLHIVRHAFMRRLRGPTLLSFGHATEGGVAGVL